MKYIYYFLAYLIGSISFSYFFVKLKTGEDIREAGSKNAGGTNVVRNYGYKLGIFTAICDMLKGTIVVFLFKKFDLGIPLLALFFAVVGHCYPFYLGFRGGKGVATSVGGIAILYCKFIPFGLILFLGLVLLSKHVSLGSIFTIFSVGSLILYTTRLTNIETFAVIGIVSIVILRHSSNIVRLFYDKEGRVKFGGKK